MKPNPSYGLHPAVSLLCATAEALALALRRLAERGSHRRLARRTKQPVACLDARTLRDIGLSHIEIRCASSAIAGDADATLRRTSLLHT